MSTLKDRLIALDDQRQAGAALGALALRGAAVFCWCNRCAEGTTIAARALLPRLGPGLAAAEIGARLRCASCGAKDVATRPADDGAGAIDGAVAA
jgi:hypothetical protein